MSNDPNMRGRDRPVPAMVAPPSVAQRPQNPVLDFGTGATGGGSGGGRL